MPLIGAGGDIIRRSDVNEESRYNQQILLLHRTISLLLTKPEGVGCISKGGREREREGMEWWELSYNLKQRFLQRKHSSGNTRKIKRQTKLEFIDP